MNEGIKIGQKVKGFRFDNSSGVHYNEQMEKKMVGKTGTITAIYEDHFAITFGGFNSWTYPLSEYLAIQREEKLKELGL